MKIPMYYNWRNMLDRRFTTMVTLLGIGLVVFVFAAVLMLANGLRTTLVSTGDADNAIFLRKGSTAEISSGIDRDQYNIIRTQGAVATRADGTPLVAGEVVVLNNLPKRGSGAQSNVTVRGVGKESLALRSRMKLVEGRMWQPGTSEVIAGRGVAERFKGCGLGETVRMGGREWKVVGVFEAGGSAFESELWGDVEQFMDAFNRPVFSSITIRMSDPSKFEEVKARLESEARLTVDMKRERDYYEAQSASLALFIKILGLTVTIIFSFGAMTGAMITMYSAVANRSTEIGTLRAS